MKSHPLCIAKLTLSFALAAGVLVLLWSHTAAHAQTSAAQKQGTVEMIKMHGKALEGNLEGDSPDRDVYVYLPPSYATDKQRRYPVVYFLHGYGAHAEMYWRTMTVPATADKEMDAGTVQEMILVHPDSYTIYNGSMYSNSPTTGNWEDYITHDLVEYIDSHYRTVATREGRGLAGHSMGGYGTLRIAMKYPEVYSSVYAMSSCCLMNNPGAPPRPAPAPAQTQAQGQNGRGGQAGRAGRGGGFANVQSAEAAAWSPNPQNPPKFFDLPRENDTVRPEIVAKWIANSPLAMVDQYASNLKKYRAVKLDVGLQDGLAASNQEMDASLTRLGVPHTFETYEGDHMNHVKDRFETSVLPFFSKNLQTATQSARR